MEMTLTVHVPRRRPLPVDVVVEWVGEHCAADLCRALADHLGEPVPALTSRGQYVEPAAVVGLPPLVHGASVAVSPASPSPTATVTSHGLVELVVVGGPDAGRAHPLLPPGVSVGRAPAVGLALADDALSRVHAVFDVGPAGISVSDAGSTNGVVVNGIPVAEPTPVDATSTIVVGSSTMRIRRVAGRGLPLDHPGDGTLVVRPSRWPEPDLGPVEVVCPPPPPERHRVRIPWIAALVPVPIGVGLAFVLGPYLLVFALMGPLVLLASALGDRWGSGRAHRRALATHADDVEAARRSLGVALAEEAARLRRAHPDPHAVLATVEGVLPGLWAGGDALPLRLGLGAVPTRVAWVDTGSRTHPTVDDAPVVVDLDLVRALAVVGPARVTDGHLRALIGQLCATHPAHQVSLAVTAPDASWAWTALLPHHVDLSALFAPQPLAAAADSHRVLVIPRADAVDGGTAALITRALDAGAHVIVAVTERSGVPGGVATVVAPGPDGRHVVETVESSSGSSVTLDLVGPWWADRLGRALAPLRTRDDGRGGGLPKAVSLAQVWGSPGISSTDVESRWRGRPDGQVTPAAVVGVTRDGPFSIDLVRDGPHVLVGGTTGSGKSEFLRTLVTSLALAHPPDELTFVLVDFKGGAAFGACTALPHVVGLVTDLDEHLVARALRSLGAELRRRERIFAAAGASDLEGYRRMHGAQAECVPRLVVVVDELKALVDEVPDFVSGLVRLAALGRSLGVHLVLATQRPAGAVTAEIQANVNLRIAFRVRDRADSVDILEDPAAAGIRSSTPGRALCRGGDGSLVTFQAATVSDAGPEPTPHLTLHPPGLSAAAAPPPEAEPGPDTAAALAPVIDAISRAHRRSGGPDPRRPWLPPLPSHLQPVVEPRIPDGERSFSAVVGLVDEPELQRVSPLVWTPDDGTWLLSGRAGSGRTSALRTMTLAIARRLSPHRLHVHVIDPVGSLADLEHLPHLGTRIGPTHHRGLDSLLAHLKAEIEVRRSPTHSPERAPEALAPTDPVPETPPLVLVVIDGWDQLAESHGPLDADGAVDSLFTILRDGPPVGVVGIVSGGRTLLQPRWSGIGGRILLLGAVDPLDAALAGLRLADVPRDPPVGRAVRPLDRREIQFALTTPEDSQALGAAPEVTRPRPAGGTATPWTWRELPPLARRPSRPENPVAGPGRHASDSPRTLSHQLDVGLVAPQGDVWGWRPAEAGRRLLVAGPPASGRTNTLTTIAGSALAAGLPVAVVLGCGVGGGAGETEQSGFGGATVLPASDVGALVTLRRRHPDLVVLVDDADRIGDDAPILPVLREVLDLVDRGRGLVAVSTTSSSVTTRFRGLDVDVARHRVGIILSPERAEADLLGARLREAPPRMPGRGVAIVRGEVAEVQVFLADDSG